MSDSLIKLRRSSVPGKVPTTEQLELGEIAINTHDGRMYIKTEQDAQQAIVEFTNNVPVTNVIFVQKDGDDDNDGTSWSTAYATIEKAIEDAQTRDDITLIDLAPGEYETEGNLDMPDNCMIRCVHRSVVIRPKSGFEVNNVFRMGSGCFIEGPIFEGWQLDSLDNPTKGFAVCFRPGANIRRAPYAHKIAVRTNPYWRSVAPPLDRENGNPIVGIGAGVALADGDVCSPYSIYPNIMTWGATPVSHNGIGYCAKNGGLINAVNAISIWAHKHFLALNGGQIILSSCSTQFGDYTMVADGTRSIVFPNELDEDVVQLNVQNADADIIDGSRQTLIDDTWNQLDTDSAGYTVGWTADDEERMRTDLSILIQSVIWVLQSANEKPMLDFAKSLFDVDSTTIFSADKLSGYVFAFETLRDEINSLTGFSATSQGYVTPLIDNLVQTTQNPPTREEPSIITAIGHTWTGIFAGVALTKIPPVVNEARIEDSILELDQGQVIASGQDDQGSALFIGGLKIDADTGELTGPPFDSAVNRIATKAAIARGF